MDAQHDGYAIDRTPPARGTDVPIEILVAAGGHALRVRWPDAAAATLPSSRLRAACRCAHCMTAARKGHPVTAVADVTVRDLQPCGANALNIVFSDGHARGIYPFAYLAALAAERAVEAA